MDTIYRGFEIKYVKDKMSTKRRWHVFHCNVRVHIAETEDAAYAWVDAERKLALNFK